MDEEKIMEWAKEHYPQYLENKELIKSLYKRQVLGESIRDERRKLPFRRLKDLKKGETVKAKVVIVEIRRKGIKNRKWFSCIIGDNSGMQKATLFLDKTEDDIHEGEEYVVKLTYRKDDDIVGNPIEKIEDKTYSLNIDAIYEYIFELNGGRVVKDRLKMFVEKRGIDFEKAKDMFNLEEDGEVVVAR